MNHLKAMTYYQLSLSFLSSVQQNSTKKAELPKNTTITLVVFGSPAFLLYWPRDFLSLSYDRFSFISIFHSFLDFTIRINTY